MALPCSSVNGFWQSSSLLGQMEGEVKWVQVEEHIPGHTSDRTLRHLSKHCIAQLIESSSSSTGNTI